MNEEEQLLVEKIAFLRYELAKCADAGQKFSINKELEETGRRLREIRNSSSTDNQAKPNSNQNKMGKKPPKSTTEKKIPQSVFLALGISFILLAFVMAFIFPCPKPIQYIAIRIVFTLGGGFLGGFMAGFLEIRTSWLTAAGGLALAILFYLWNPAQIVTNDCNEVVQIKGTVFIDNKTQEGVTVKLQQAQRDNKTNSYGIFEMKINQNDLKPKLDFTFIYSQLYIDTVFTIEKDKVDLTDLKFYLLEGKKPIVEINEDPKPTNTNQTTLSKPKINYHSITLQGDYKTVDYVLFDNNKIQPKNGIVKLPNLNEDFKNVKIYFKDISKQNYDKDINNQVTEIAIN